MDQEGQSRGEFSAFLERQGWSVSWIRDLGEDFLIQIYDGGLSTGLTFYVQLKSAHDIRQYTLKDGTISYPFDVKDLIHWRGFDPPVFLVIWHVGVAQGYWIPVNEALERLDLERPLWHKQQTHA